MIKYRKREKPEPKYFKNAKKKIINKNEKKNWKKKINGAYIQVPTKLKIKSPSPFRKNQTQKHKKKLQRRAKEV